MPQGLRDGDELADVDEADVAGVRTEDRRLVSRQRRLAALLQGECPARIGHGFADHQFGFARQPIHNVVDADRLRDVIDEIDEPADTDQRQQHRTRDARDRYERVRQCPRGRQRRDAVGERSEEEAERPLRGPVPGEADQNAR